MLLRVLGEIPSAGVGVTRQSRDVHMLVPLFRLTRSITPLGSERIMTSCLRVISNSEPDFSTAFALVNALRPK